MTTTEVKTGVRFVVRQYVLLTVLEKAGSVVPRQDVLPVLKNFKLTLDDSGITVVATDLELTVIAHSAVVEVQRPGTLLFPAARLLAIVKEVNGGEVMIDVLDETTASITAGHASWTVRLAESSTVDSWPLLPEIAGLAFHEIDRLRFMQAISATRGAASTEVTRPNLMMLNIQDGRMTACDGARLQQYGLGEDFPIDMSLPIGAITDLLKMLNFTAAEKISVAESPEHLVFKAGEDVFLATKLVAKFPPVEKTMLEAAMGNNWVLTVDRAELEQSIRRVRIMADAETSAVTLGIEGQHLTIGARDKSGNMGTDQLDIGWSGPAHTVVVNHRFLMEMLEMYSGRVATLKLGPDSGKRKAAVLLVDDSGDDPQFGLIQQMRTGS